MSGSMMIPRDAYPWFQIGAAYGREAQQNYLAYPDEIKANIRGAPGLQIGGCPSCGGGVPGYGVSGSSDTPVSFAMPTTYRKYPIGFDSTADIANGAVLTVTTQIQVPFRGLRLVFDPQNAYTWFLQQLLTGIQVQQPALVNMPGAAFLPESLVPLELDTAQVGNFLSLVMQNRSTGGQRFKAGMIGDVVKA